MTYDSQVAFAIWESFFCLISSGIITNNLFVFNGDLQFGFSSTVKITISLRKPKK